MKTMCPPGYHHNSSVVTHALGHMMYGLDTYHVPKCMGLPQSHWRDNQGGHIVFMTTYIYMICI